jgi:murein DD-endopeptidase MepM/ murein hydrolase activator NlpD
VVSRWRMHVAVVGLAVVALAASHLSGLRRQTGRADEAPPAEMLAVAHLSRQTSARGSGYLVRAAQPHTTISESPTAVPDAPIRRTEIYRVQPGDTVLALAERFGITPGTILSANGGLGGNADLLSLGQELVIPPLSGVVHEVEPGETLASIAERYQVDIDTIIAHQENNLSEPYSLQVGQKLLLPGAELPNTPFAGYAWTSSSGESTIPASGSFVWPTAGVISQGVWWGHVAIDLATQPGTPIYASDAGYVVEAGWSGAGYGQYVLIDHGNGFRTLYAHMSTILAWAGQSVDKGAVIGRVGSTGNSTGPHLHFEIYKDGVLQNPFNYLP